MSLKVNLQELPKKRITITLDEELDRKIRNLQVRFISSTQKGWSYSKVLTALVKNGLDSKTVKNLASKTTG
ncbi:MAG: hypothetical protein QW177_07110 [Candidatus Nitrosotenuis sp.]